MFYALPAETVFEAKERTKRATVYLFILLLALYIFFANLMTLSVYLFFPSTLRSAMDFKGWADFQMLVLFSTLAAVGVGVIHFLVARAKSLNDLLEQIKAKDADPKDVYHAQFIQIVEELEAATGIQGIKPVVLGTTGCNAFSLQDGKGQCAIGVTEGLLSKLNRQELSAVVAHEAAHLVHEDSRLVTTACFLFGVFGQLNAMLGNVISTTSSNSSGFYGSSYRGRSSVGSNRVSGVVFLLWAISGLGYLITKLISMAISREREYLADADGVQMCKDPFALAESLYKISRRYRGDTPDTYSSLFIMNPSDSDLDDQEGFVSNLFSNHPPVSKRLEKLLNWAKADIETLKEKDEQEEKAQSGAPAAAPATPASPTSFMTFQDNQWMGPYTPLQLLSLSFTNPATWVCPAGSQQVSKASDVPELIPLFQKQVQGSVSKNACPRCKVPLVTTRYEGSEVENCTFCKGYLLRAGVLERLITREEVTFSPEEIKKAKTWRDSQRGPLKDRDHFPEIKCPYCQSIMCKGIHSMLTQVVVDHCSNDACGSIWCDGGELETIQMLIEDAHKARI